MSESHSSTGSDKPLIFMILGVIVLYAVLAGLGLPQKWTDQASQQAHEGGDQPAAAAHHDDTPEHDHADTGTDHAHEDGDADHEAGDEHAQDHATAPEDQEHGTRSDAHVAPAAGDQQGGHGAVAIEPPPIWTVIPFALLLGAIAILPLMPWTEHWWEDNKSRFMVAAILGILTLAYYLFFHTSAVEAHWPGHAVVEASESGLNHGLAWTVLGNAIFGEYIPFIVLLFSLYTISGGIRIEGDLPAHPKTNTIFIAVGGLLASFIGTTGAAMLLIRPLLETNRERKCKVHTVVFFIFVVCNCGGCLLPIGDPPLFLGYLRGVEFLWTFNLWPQWLFVNGVLLAMYFLWDTFVSYPKEEIVDIARDETQVRKLKFSGLWPNVPLLIGVVLGVALLAPGKEILGWNPWMYAREIAQIALVALSLILGSAAIRRANSFNYHAIIEVAALFFGIFICMQAPLQILNATGDKLGLTSPMHFFWATGTLSSVLDNAPTYVVFFETAKTLTEATPALASGPTMADVAEHLLVAISLGAVFMGAMTYIGNGPNFMVKAVAEQSGIKMPSFFGYMLYSCAILLPVLILTTLVFG
jgi:Na+/H+ antiporter NhaD/arsenite permease-like protein